MGWVCAGLVVIHHSTNTRAEQGKSLQKASQWEAFVS
jgi:hypothetical protein